MITIANTSTLTYTVTGLGYGHWLLAVASYNAGGTGDLSFFKDIYI